MSAVLLDAQIALDESEGLRELFILNCKLEILLKHAIKTDSEAAGLKTAVVHVHQSILYYLEIAQLIISGDCSAKKLGPKVEAVRTNV